MTPPSEPVETGEKKDASYPHCVQCGQTLPSRGSDWRRRHCDGSGTCPSRLHVHPCRADDGTACDAPWEHATPTPREESMNSEDPLRKYANEPTIRVHRGALERLLDSLGNGAGGDFDLGVVRDVRTGHLIEDTRLERLRAPRQPRDPWSGVCGGFIDLETDCLLDLGHDGPCS